MLCIKCKKTISDDSIYCKYCGKKQVKTPAPKTLKRANGQGSVYKLSGRRRKPWVAAKNKMILGYFETKTDALNHLNNAVVRPISDKLNYTLEQAYNEWSKQHYTTISKSQQDVLRASWLYYEPLYKSKIKDLRTEHYQQAIDTAVSKNKSRSTCEKIRQLCSGLCKYAMQYDIINKNYSQFLKLPKKVKKEKAIFTDNQIKLLFKKSDNDSIKIILILIYSGMRINELLKLKKENVNIDEHYIIGGSKTEAGTDRLIPINDKIIDFLKYFMKSSKSDYLMCNTKGNKKDVKHFRDDEFYPTLKELNINGLTPHCTRHTFASLSSKAGMKPEVLQKILGHADYATTAEIYIHQDKQTLIDAINKI